MKNIIISSMIDLTKEVFTLIKKDYEVFLVSIDFNPDYDNLYKIADDLPPFYFNQVSYYLNFNFDDLPNTVLGNYLKNKDLKDIYLELVPFFCFNYLAGDVNLLKLGLIILEIEEFSNRHGFKVSSVMNYKEKEVAKLVKETMLTDLPYNLIFIDSEIEIFNYLTEEKSIEVAKTYHEIVKMMNKKYKNFSKNNTSLNDYIKYYDTIDYEDVFDFIYDFVNSKIK